MSHVDRPRVPQGVLAVNSDSQNSRDLQNRLAREKRVADAQAAEALRKQQAAQAQQKRFGGR